MASNGLLWDQPEVLFALNTVTTKHVPLNFLYSNLYMSHMGVKGH